MMRWLETLQLHNFHQTAEKMKETTASESNEEEEDEEEEEDGDEEEKEEEKVEKQKLVEGDGNDMGPCAVTKEQPRSASAPPQVE